MIAMQKVVGSGVSPISRSRNTCSSARIRVIAGSQTPARTAELRVYARLPELPAQVTKTPRQGPGSSRGEPRRTSWRRAAASVYRASCQAAVGDLGDQG